MAQVREMDLGGLLAFSLHQHREMNPGEPHGIDACSICMLYAVLGVVLDTIGASALPLKLGKGSDDATRTLPMV